MDSRYFYIIDNGHGKNTRGKRSPKWNNGKQLFEYKFNRGVANSLSALLEETNIDHTLICPEIRDVSLSKRCNRANKLNSKIEKPTLFISIHGNAYKDEGVNGVETFHHGSSAMGNRFAKIFQDSLIEELGWNDRGVKTANFKVLRSTVMPSILTENGFYTNYKECMKMIDEGWQRRIAYAHYNAIMKIEGVDL